MSSDLQRILDSIERRAMEMHNRGRDLEGSIDEDIANYYIGQSDGMLKAVNVIKESLRQMGHALPGQRKADEVESEHNYE